MSPLPKTWIRRPDFQSLKSFASHLLHQSNGNIFFSPFLEESLWRSVGTTSLSSLQGELLDLSKPPIPFFLCVTEVTLSWFWALEIMYTLYCAQCLAAYGCWKDTFDTYLQLNSSSYYYYFCYPAAVTSTRVTLFFASPLSILIISYA